MSLAGLEFEVKDDTTDQVETTECSKLKISSAQSQSNNTSDLPIMSNNTVTRQKSLDSLAPLRSAHTASKACTSRVVFPCELPSQQPGGCVAHTFSSIVEDNAGQLTSKGRQPIGLNDISMTYASMEGTDAAHLRSNEIPCSVSRIDTKQQFELSPDIRLTEIGSDCPSTPTQPQSCKKSSPPFSNLIVHCRHGLRGAHDFTTSKGTGVRFRLATKHVDSSEEVVVSGFSSPVWHPSAFTEDILSTKNGLQLPWYGGGCQPLSTKILERQAVVSTRKNMFVPKAWASCSPHQIIESPHNNNNYSSVFLRTYKNEKNEASSDFDSTRGKSVDKVLEDNSSSSSSVFHHPLSEEILVSLSHSVDRVMSPNRFLTELPSTKCKKEDPLVLTQYLEGSKTITKVYNGTSYVDFGSPKTFNQFSSTSSSNSPYTMGYHSAPPREANNLFGNRVLFSNKLDDSNNRVDKSSSSPMFLQDTNAVCDDFDTPLERNLALSEFPISQFHAKMDMMNDVISNNVTSKNDFSAGQFTGQHSFRSSSTQKETTESNLWRNFHLSSPDNYQNTSQRMRRPSYMCNDVTDLAEMSPLSCCWSMFPPNSLVENPKSQDDHDHQLQVNHDDFINYEKELKIVSGLSATTTPPFLAQKPPNLMEEEIIDPLRLTGSLIEVHHHVMGQSPTGSFDSLLSTGPSTSPTSCSMQGTPIDVVTTITPPNKRGSNHQSPSIMMERTIQSPPLLSSPLLNKVRSEPVHYYYNDDDSQLLLLSTTSNQKARVTLESSSCDDVDSGLNTDKTTSKQFSLSSSSSSIPFHKKSPLEVNEEERREEASADQSTHCQSRSKHDDKKKIHFEENMNDIYTKQSKGINDESIIKDPPSPRTSMVQTPPKKHHAMIVKVESSEEENAAQRCSLSIEDINKHHLNSFIDIDNTLIHSISSISSNNNNDEMIPLSLTKKESRVGDQSSMKHSSAIKSRTLTVEAAPPHVMINSTKEAERQCVATTASQPSYVMPSCEASFVERTGTSFPSVRSFHDEHLKCGATSSNSMEHADNNHLYRFNHGHPTTMGLTSSIDNNECPTSVVTSEIFGMSKSKGAVQSELKINSKQYYDFMGSHQQSTGSRIPLSQSRHLVSFDQSNRIMKLSSESLMKQQPYHHDQYPSHLYSSSQKAYQFVHGQFLLDPMSDTLPSRSSNGNYDYLDNNTNTPTRATKDSKNNIQDLVNDARKIDIKKFEFPPHGCHHQAVPKNHYKNNNSPWGSQQENDSLQRQRSTSTSCSFNNKFPPDNNYSYQLPSTETIQTDESYILTYQKEELTGRVLGLAKVQSGSRFLQRLLSRGNPDGVALVLNEIQHRIADLMIDPYGNYLCQQLFGVCSPVQRSMILKTLAPRAVEISCDRRGTHSMQALITLIQTSDEAMLLINELKDQILHLSVHPHGTHVIQRALTCFSAPSTDSIFEPIIQNLDEVARSPHGLCVVKKCITTASHSSSRFVSELLHRLSQSALGLIQSPYGNYAIQQALEVWGPTVCSPILSQVKSHLVTLSTQKFSSNVVEKSIEIGTDADVREILAKLTLSSTISVLINSSYGNFVVQKALDKATEQEARDLFFSLTKNNRFLQNKRLKIKWERIIETIVGRLRGIPNENGEAAQSKYIIFLISLLDSKGVNVDDDHNCATTTIEMEMASTTKQQDGKQEIYDDYQYRQLLPLVVDSSLSHPNQSKPIEHIDRRKKKSYRKDKTTTISIARSKYTKS